MVAGRRRAGFAFCTCVGEDDDYYGMVLIIYCYYGKVLLCICMYESALELCVHTRTNSPACAEVHPHPHRLACNCIGQRRIAIG